MNKRKKVIILYGPPGVGKLTVAKQLTKQTGFKIFHVHLLADLLNSIFEFGTKEFADNFTYLWLFLFQKALIKNQTGLIVTLIYGVQTLEGKKDDAFFKKIIKIAKQSKADIFFVKLKCSDQEINKRIRAVDRKKFNKLTDPNKLKILRQKYKVDQLIPFYNSLEIDTTKLKPEQTAIKIKRILS
jgi:hypothetical protein